MHLEVRHKERADAEVDKGQRNALDVMHQVRLVCGGEVVDHGAKEDDEERLRDAVRDGGDLPRSQP